MKKSGNPAASRRNFVAQIAALGGAAAAGSVFPFAAHAQAAKLTLVTNNEREFRRVPGLKLQNWTARHP